MIKLRCNHIKPQKPHVIIEIICHIGGRKKIKINVIIKDSFGETNGVVGICKPFTKINLIFIKAFKITCHDPNGFAKVNMAHGHSI